MISSALRCVTIHPASLGMRANMLRVSSVVGVVAGIVWGVSAGCPAMAPGNNMAQGEAVPHNHPAVPGLPGRPTHAQTARYGAAVADLDLRAVQRDLVDFFKVSQPSWPADWADLPGGANYG